MTPIEQYNIMIDYIKVKIAQCDWHGVADAANDIRELLALHPTLKSQENIKMRRE